jgi:serine/threonine protein kinase
VTEQEQALVRIEQATAPQDLFTNGDLQREFRRLAKLVHEDVLPRHLRERGNKAFAKLVELRDQLSTSVETHETVSVGDWLVTKPFRRGDLCSLYFAHKKDETTGLLKVPRMANALGYIAREAEVLRKIHACRTQYRAFGHYFPRVLDSFVDDEGTPVNVLTKAPGITLQQVLAHYPDGLDFRHVVWIGNRLFSALGYAHYNGSVHCAPFPEHLVLDVENHHLVLVGWCQSTPLANRATIISTDHVDDYPPEVTERWGLSAATDLYLAAQTLRRAARNIPPRFRPLFDLWMADSPNSRGCGTPLGAKERWLQLAQEEYGPPTFVPLTVPGGTNG